MFAVYHPEDLTTVFHHKSKQDALEDLQDNYVDFSEFVILDVSELKETSEPADDYYIYILVSGEFAYSQEFGAFSKEAVVEMDNLDMKYFIGLDQDGSGELFCGSDIK